MSVTFDVSRTPLLVGRDPFERFPDSDSTSAGIPTTRAVDNEHNPVRRLTSALSAIVAALTPTHTSLTPTAPPKLLAALVMPGLLERIPTALEMREEIRVLPVRGIELIDESTLDVIPIKAAPSSNTERALQAAADLATWLGITEEHLADLAGFSRRNYSNWRLGHGSYPKTVRGLFEIHALVAGLMKTLGPNDAVAWLSMPTSGSSQRKQLLGTAEGRSQLLAEASDLLFAPTEREEAVADFEDAREGVELAIATRRSAALANSPPIRRRKPK